jgi:hypothetical protein
MRRAPVLAALLVLALVAGGCGGGGGGTSKEAYTKDLARTSQQVQRTFSDILAGSGAGTSAKQAGDRLARSAAALDDAAKRFGELTPPDAAKAAHRKLVAGLKELADAFRQAAAAARSDNAKGLAQTLQRLTSSDGVKKINEAQRELSAQGIDVTKSSGG